MKNGKSFERHTKKCVLNTMKLVAQNGVLVFNDLDSLAMYLNSLEKNTTLSRKQ